MAKYPLTLVCGLLIICFAAITAPAAIFTVTSTVDGGPGSLRDAIMAANGTPGPDLIDFAIMPPGPHTIVPLSPLPPLLDPAGVFIDGTTQPGTICGPTPPATILMIEISGFAAGPTPGLWVLSDLNTIQGLCINSFQQDGILIEGGMANPSANLNVVRCCFIGTDLAGGADMGNGTNQVTLYAGVRIKNVQGGIALDNLVEGCLISGNYADGVSIWGPIIPGDVGFNIVFSCFIGTDILGSADLGNDNEGVSMVEGTHDNRVMDNLISGNDFDGVGIQGFNNIPFGPPILTFANLVENNTIGLDINFNPLPNSMHGVAIGTYGPNFWGCADGNFIVNNRIAANGGDGVYVWEDPVDNFNADHNLISMNSIFNNAGLGIDLHNNGVTPNDPADPDVLANEEMNFPVIASANEAAGTTTITGTLDTPAPNTATVEVFKARLDPTGYGEGEVFLGSTNPDPLGNWIIAVGGLVGGDSVTATATDAGNNTSEFSQCVDVISPNCCIGIRGDCDQDGTDANILDLTFLVDYIFRGSGNPGSCLPESDVDGDGTPANILDLTYLVDRVFRGGPLPPSC